MCGVDLLPSRISEAIQSEMDMREEMATDCPGVTAPVPIAGVFCLPCEVKAKHDLSHLLDT
jgi:hypothetical protein